MISDNHKSVRGIPEIPAAVQKLFPTAHDISVDYHIQIQAASQRHTDNGVSKTINLPKEATLEEVRSAYLLAVEDQAPGPIQGRVLPQVLLLERRS